MYNVSVAPRLGSGTFVIADCHKARRRYTSPSAYGSLTVMAVNGGTTATSRIALSTLGACANTTIESCPWLLSTMIGLEPTFSHGASALLPCLIGTNVWQ